MNNDGRTTSEQLYIPNFLIVGGSQSLLLRCFHASKTLGLAIKVCTAAEATVIVARRHPIAIVVPNDVFAGAAYELVAVARDVRSALLPVDPEVSVRELEAMLAAAVDGGFSQRERRGGAGCYSIVEGIEEEAPFSRRSQPPPSMRSPGVASARASLPPESLRSSSVPPVSVRPSVAPPVSARPSVAPPVSARSSVAPPVSVRPSVVQPVSARSSSVPPVSVRPSVVQPVSARSSSVPPLTARSSSLPAVSVPPAPVRPSVVSASPRPATAPTSRTLPSFAAPAAGESVPPPDSGVQKAAVGAFAAIRSVFTTRR